MRSERLFPSPALRVVRAVSVLGMTLSSAVVAAAPLPAATFFQPNDVSNAAISPDGRMVAMVTRPKGMRAGVLLVDLTTMTPYPLARYDNGDVDKVFWLTDKRLSYTVINVPEHVVDITSGLYAVDTDRTNSRVVFHTIPAKYSFMGLTSIGLHSPPFRAVGRQSSNTMFFSRSHEGGRNSLFGIDTLTLKQADIDTPRSSHGWLIDEDDQARVAVGKSAGGETVHVRRESKWEELASFAPLSDQAFKPLVYTRSGFYVRAYGSADRASLYRYDLAKPGLYAEPLITSPNYDIDGEPISDDHKMIGYRVRLDAEETIWFDETMKAVQKEVDAMLPATINRLARAKRQQTSFFLVESWSAVDPGQLLIYNRDTRKLIRLGQRNPDIDPAAMAETSFDKYTTRDGKTMPLLLTLPKGRAPNNLPAIVLLSASPWQRNTVYDWNKASQFLASRGYVVIEPEARGTVGYGRANFKSGMGQWGRTMQDDLSDSARWAVAKGYADPKRICIVGATYGGYAALMGVIREPDLFRCAVSMAGIVDIGMMFANDWTGFTPPDLGYDMKELVGDPKADKERLLEVSPLRQAGRVKSPVFLAYGKRDVIVPERHGQMLYDAIMASSPESEFHLFPDSQSMPEQNLPDLWAKIETFLARHLRPR